MVRPIFFFSFCFYFWIAAPLRGASSPALPNTLRIGLAGYPSSNLFPLGYDEYSEAITSLVLEPLIRLDLDNLKPEPGLGQLKSINKSATRFKIEINPLAKFSDGKPVTAEDVCFTFNLIRSPHARVMAYGSLFKAFTDCKVNSSHQVTFQSQSSLWTGPQLLAQLYIFPQHVFSKRNFVKDFNQSYLGSGPYIFESVRPGHSVILKKNPTYWASALAQSKGKYQLEHIEFHTQSEPSALLKMLVQHQIDYLYFLSAKSWIKDTDQALFKNGKIVKLAIKNKIPFAQAGIAWNLRKPLFQDIRVRKALALLFNREKLIKDFFYQQYELATGVAPSLSEFHHPSNRPILYNPTQASKILKKAGWTLNSRGLLEKNKQLLKFELLTGHSASSKIWALYQEDLRKAGIQLSVRVVDWATYIRLRNMGQFEALDFSRNRDEWMTDLSLTWHSSRASNPGLGNVTGFKDPQVDRLLEQIDQTPLGKKRTQIIQELDLLISQQIPMAFSWEPRSQRIAFWNQYSFDPPGFFQYSRWNQLFHFWKWCPTCLG